VARVCGCSAPRTCSRRGSSAAYWSRAPAASPARPVQEASSWRVARVCGCSAPRTLLRSGPDGADLALLASYNTITSRPDSPVASSHPAATSSPVLSPTPPRRDAVSRSPRGAVTCRGPCNSPPITGSSTSTHPLTAPRASPLHDSQVDPWRAVWVRLFQVLGSGPIDDRPPDGGERVS
jgi:hypothetical protein